MKHYKITRVQVDLTEWQPAVWKFRERPIRGTEYTYEVQDTNLAARNRWKFVVRVPKKATGRVEVRPVHIPNMKAWAGLERKVLTFMRATLPGFRDKRYCDVALADPEGAHTKVTAKWGQKAALPSWFKPLLWRMRLKKTVRAVSSAANPQVLLVKGDDDVTMIRLFFATKVWTLLEHRGLPRDSES